MITNPIGPFENVETAVEWAQTPGNMQSPAAVYTDSYGRVFVQDAARAQLFHSHEISYIINPTTNTPIQPPFPNNFFVCESCGEVVDTRYRVFIDDDGTLWPICTTCNTEREE